MFDASVFVTTRSPGLSGVGKWSLGALTSLAKLEKDWSIRGFLTSFKPQELAGELEASSLEVVSRRLPSRLFKVLQEFRFGPPLEAFVGQFDVMLGNSYVCFRTRSAVQVPVIYDLSLIKYPETHPHDRVHEVGSLLPRLIEQSTTVITISNTVRQEISECFGLDPARIAVVYPGIASDSLHEGVAAKDRAGAADNFILFVGTLEPRKNLMHLLEAYSLMRKRRPEAPRLVLAGAMGWRSENLRDRLEKLGEDDGVEVLGYVDESRLEYLYAHALALICPSKYEGFGMPILEAMAAGCPVICSNLPVFDEVTGGEALFCEQSDPEDIASAMERVIGDSALRAKLSRGGRIQARRFTWERTGTQLRDALEGALERRP